MYCVLCYYKMPAPLLLLQPAEENGRGDCIFWISGIGNGLDAALILVFFFFFGVEGNKHTAHLTDKYAPHLYYMCVYILVYGCVYVCTSDGQILCILLSWLYLLTD